MPASNVNLVPAKLLALRKKLGLSQEDLAAKVGCSKKTIENAEAGKTIKLRTAHEIAQALGVPFEALLQEPEKTESHESQDSIAADASVATAEILRPSWAVPGSVVTRVVVVFDLEGFSDKLRHIQKMAGVRAAEHFQQEIQSLRDKALAEISCTIEETLISDTGDGGILAFADAEHAVRFSENLHQLTNQQNHDKESELEQKHFRVGVAIGEVSVRVKTSDSGRTLGLDYTGDVIAVARRLESASDVDGILICMETWKKLPGELCEQFGPEETVSGKRAEKFLGRRWCVPPAVGKKPSPAAARPLRIGQRPRCLGRDDEIDAIVQAILQDGCLPIPILGGPGIGKTTLARAVLWDDRLWRRYKNRCYFVSCEAAPTREAVVGKLAQELEIESSVKLERAVLDKLVEAPCCLVLDNAETPWLAVPAWSFEELLNLLAGLPGLVLLVTIRSGERPGGIQWHDSTDLRPLKPDVARELFLQIAGRQFNSDPLLDALLRDMGYLPLAVELLAHRSQTEPHLEGVAREWQERRTAILNRPGGNTRLANLEASFDLSLNGPRMTAAAQRLLHLLSLLPDGIAWQDLDALLPGAGSSAAGTLRKVGLAQSTTETNRLNILAPLREYLRNHEPAGENTGTAESTRQDDEARAIEHFIELAAREGHKVGHTGGNEAVHRLATEVANIDAMTRLGLEQPDPARAYAAAFGMAEFGRFTGRDVVPLVSEACATARRHKDLGNGGRSLESLGDIALVRSQHAMAKQAYEEALPLYRQVGDVRGQANCIVSLGDIALRRSEHGTAKQAYEEALPLYRQAGDVLGQANCIQSLGSIALACSEHGTAKQTYEEALPLYRQVGSVLGQANCIKSLGDIALERSEHGTARQAYEEALPLYRQVADVLGQANCIRRLGDIALRRSELGTAKQAYEEALPLYRQVGSVLGQANCIQSLGDIALWRSEHGTAKQAYEEALPLYRQVGSVLGQANCIQSLGDIAIRRSEHGTAKQAYEEALDLFERIPEPYSIGWTHVRLARLEKSKNGRREHVAKASLCWKQIDRPDLVESLRQEFPDAM
jgi:tetratricopeptide (TPR) repeat protein/transcriptional regulator with XRE-family HTH domain